MLLAVLWLVPLSADALERLFFSAEERRKLNLARDRGTSTQTYEVPNVEGMVRRSDGKNTIWINGVPFGANEGQARLADSLPASTSQQLHIKSSTEPASRAGDRAESKRKKSDK